MRIENIPVIKKLSNKNRHLLGLAFMNLTIAGFLLMDKKYIAGIEIIKKTLSL
ncbi:MAG: hypothetical protein KAS11_02565 [Candidatus Aenigmarchaeota archaeon]|nr:hypothetical protein [Candidatus Aenigmarchaeota archaeon]